MNKRLFWIVFAVAAALRLAAIWQAPLWYDENYTLILSRLPLYRMLAATAGDVHPPLWYLIVWPIGQLGGPAWLLRIPALVFSLAGLWLFWRILEAEQLHEHIRRGAVVLMAIMPFQVLYANEARMYALLQFLVLYGFYLSQRFDQRGSWLMFTLTGIAMLYTHNYGAFYLASLCVVVLVSGGALEWVSKLITSPERRAEIKSVIRLRQPLGDARRPFYAIFFAVSSGLIALVAWTPWLRVVLGQMSGIESSFWIIPARMAPGLILYTIYQQLFGALMPSISAVTVFTVWITLSTWLLIDHYRAWHILIMAFLPTVLGIIFSLIWQPVLLYRAQIGTAPFLYLSLACLLIMLRRTSFEWRYNLRRVLVASVFIVPMIVMGLGLFYVKTPDNKSDGDKEIIAYITDHWQDGDIVYHLGDGSWINETPYTDFPAYKWPDCGKVMGSLSEQTRLAMGFDIRALDDIPHQRAWIIWPQSPLQPACEAIAIPAILAGGDEVVVAIDNEYVRSSLWLVP